MILKKIIWLLTAITGFNTLSFATETNIQQSGRPIISAYELQHSSTIFAEKRRYMVSLPERYSMNKRSYPSLKYQPKVIAKL